MEARLARARRRRGAAGVLWIALLAALEAAGLACAPEAPPHPLAPPTPVRRLGAEGPAEKLAGVSKPVLATPGRLRLADLPPSRLLLAAASREAGGARCAVRLAGDGGEVQLLGELEIPPGEPRWVDHVTALPAVRTGALHLDCGESDVVWARPIAVPSASRPGPLVVLMSLDTLRADHVSGFGGDADLTPTLGRLGDEGLRMTDVAAEGTWTLPSHHALFRSRIWAFDPDGAMLPSLAESLRDLGFATLGVTGGGWLSSSFSFHLGFDHYAENFVNARDIDLILPQALAGLERAGEAPTFLFLHTYTAHELPPEVVKWQEQHGPLVPFHAMPDEAASMRAFYRERVRMLDAALEPLMERLREESAERPVLLIVLSDHGEAFGEHGTFGHGSSFQNATKLHDELVRVPLIVWGPGLVPAGRHSERPAGLTDVAPSVLAAVGLPPGPSMRGRDLWPLWSGRSDGPDPALGGVTHMGGWWALRRSDRKLIVHMQTRGRNVYELYDLAGDPAERTDRADAEPDEVRALRSELDERLAQLGLSPTVEAGYDLPRGACVHFPDLAGCGDTPAREPQLAPETRRQLRELGYVE